MNQIATISPVAGGVAWFGIDDVYRERIAEFVAKAKGAFAGNTERAIRADTADFLAWCLANGRRPMPAEPDTVARYIDQLAFPPAESGRKPLSYATIARRLPSIAWLHKAAGLDDPTRHTDVQLKRRAIARQLGRGEQRQAQGLTYNTLCAILAAIPGQEPADLRDAALMSVAYDAMLRRSELVGVQTDHIEFTPEGDATLLVPRSKTDQEGEGQHRWLRPATVGRLKAWLAVRDLHWQGTCDGLRHELAALQRDMKRGHIVNGQRHAAALSKQIERLEAAAGAVWLTLSKHGYPLGPLAVKGPDPGVRVGEIFKARAAAADVDAAMVSGHSFRVGACQDLAEKGFSLVPIQNAGGWRDPRMPARYSRKIAARKGAMAQMASQQTQ